jgi:hypothetical protein
MLVLGVLVLLFSACTGPQKNTGPDITRMEPPDESRLQAKLGMVRASTDLGYQEKSFDTCQMGLRGECGRKYLAVVNFQLMCRETEGTVSTFPLELHPIVAPVLRWSMGRASGETQTDVNGYGQIAVITDRPLSHSRLLLKKERLFVAITAGEITRIVLPKNWCPGDT